MPLHKARRTDLSRRAGRPDGVIYRQRTRSFYVGKSLPRGVELCIGTDTKDSDTPDDKENAATAQAS